MAATCKAMCVVVSETGNNQVLGHVLLTQADTTHPVKVTGVLTGLAPGKHGISICVSGDLSQGAVSCGPIFNPFGEAKFGVIVVISCWEKCLPGENGILVLCAHFCCSSSIL
jgi:Cu/Zn superoxide dismutase